MQNKDIIKQGLTTSKWVVTLTKWATSEDILDKKVTKGNSLVGRVVSTRKYQAPSGSTWILYASNGANTRADAMKSEPEAPEGSRSWGYLVEVVDADTDAVRGWAVVIPRHFVAHYEEMLPIWEQYEKQQEARKARELFVFETRQKIEEQGRRKRDELVESIQSGMATLLGESYSKTSGVKGLSTSIFYNTEWSKDPMEDPTAEARVKIDGSVGMSLDLFNKLMEKMLYY
jgi:hypothetical protein